MICFICNSKHNTDTSHYSDDGRKCEFFIEKKTAKQLLDTYLKDVNNRFFNGLQAPRIQISGSCHDIYAAVVFYH